MSIVLFPGCAQCTSPFLTLWYILCRHISAGIYGYSAAPYFGKRKAFTKNNRLKREKHFELYFNDFYLYYYNNYIVIYRMFSMSKSQKHCQREFPESLNKHFYYTHVCHVMASTCVHYPAGKEISK